MQLVDVVVGAGDELGGDRVVIEGVLAVFLDNGRAHRLSTQAQDIPRARVTRMYGPAGPFH
jgi:hypothetical protein